MTSLESSTAVDPSGCGCIDCTVGEGNFGRQLHDIERKARELGAVGIIAKADQLRARMNEDLMRALWGKR